VRIVWRFDAEVLYIPFGLMWARFVYAFLHKNTKIVTTIHDVTSHDKFNVVEKVSSLLNYGAARFVDAFVILNKKDKSIVENRYNKPVAVIPHAAFNYYFSGDKKEFKLTRTIGFFGRIEPYKGLGLLVEAFELCKVDGLNLQITGSGKVEESLLERIGSNPDIILINRYIKDEEFQQFLDKVDFVVLPYKRASQSGVIPMCFAYGKTVIATNVGALSEQVPEGTGALTDIDAKAIAVLIDKLYENPDKIKAMGESAFKYAQKELSWDHSAGLLTDFIRTL
jgi:glycosyltransferase involved in cell wall biosynthesis